jgi:ParB family chromosome partitioning protein
VVHYVKRGVWRLIAGAHRLAAVPKLGHNKIDATVLHGLDIDAMRLAEIDENLVRADLTPGERALHLAERKRLYEKLHPETKHGGDRKSAGSTRQNGDLIRFTQDAADKTGRSERTVQRELERADKISDLADLVGTPLTRQAAATRTERADRARQGGRERHR